MSNTTTSEVERMGKPYTVTNPGDTPIYLLSGAKVSPGETVTVFPAGTWEPQFYPGCYYIGTLAELARSQDGAPID